MNNVHVGFLRPQNRFQSHRCVKGIISPEWHKNENQHIHKKLITCFLRKGLAASFSVWLCVSAFTRVGAL